MIQLFYSKKYQQLLLSIALFIVLDAALFGLNYYSSIKFQQNNQAINQTGQLQMLSQQLAKSLLTLQAERKSSAITQSSLAQISESHDNLEKSIKVLSLDFAPKNDSKLNTKVNKIQKEWLSWKSDLNPLLTADEFTDEAVDFAINKVNTKNIYFLSLCDDLIADIEASASSALIWLRAVLLVLLFLAISNFIYIVFNFIKKLSRNDLEIEIANVQKNRILSAVNEGLLLVLPNGMIAHEMSNASHHYFGRNIIPGTLFLDLFKPHLDASQLKQLSSYLTLAFDKNVSLNTLRQLHPLKELKMFANGNSKFLSFIFTPIVENEQVVELLITVNDITELVELRSRVKAK